MLAAMVTETPLGQVLPVTTVNVPETPFAAGTLRAFTLVAGKVARPLAALAVGVAVGTTLATGVEEVPPPPQPAASAATTVRKPTSRNACEFI
jgi:hypothetical protein